MNKSTNAAIVLFVTMCGSEVESQVLEYPSSSSGNAVLVNLINTGAKTNAETVYMSPSGSDLAAGTEAAPVLTGNTALSRIRGNGTVRMLAGIYSTKFDLSLVTNVTIIGMGVGVTNRLGSNVNSFTDLGGGMYSFQYASNAWVSIDTNNSPYIYELGNSEGLIDRTNRQPMQHQHNYRLRGVTRLRQIAHLSAPLTNGSFVVSNNTIFFKTSDGGAIGARTIQLPDRWDTNSFTINPSVSPASVTIRNVESQFGNSGFDVTGTFYAELTACKGMYSYIEGIVDNGKFGPLEMQDCEFAGNNNDGVGLTWSRATTNDPMTRAEGIWIHDNGDEGWSDHTGAMSSIHNLLVEWNTTPLTAGVNSSGGSRVYLNGFVARNNDTALLSAGAVLATNPAWTNMLSTIIARGGHINDCRLGVSHTFGSDQERIDIYDSYIHGTQLSIAHDTAGQSNSILVVNCTLGNNLIVGNPVIVGPLFENGGRSSAILLNTNFAVANLVATNAAVRAGASTSNAAVGGLLLYSVTSFTNHSTSGSFTNFATYTNSAHLLTNAGSAEVGVWRGTFQTGTNQLQVGLGSATNVFDTGAITNLGQKVWEAYAEVTSISPTSQRVDGYIQWDQGGGVPFTRTNFSRFVAQSNGVATRFFLAGQAIGTGRITNDFAKFHYVSSTQ